jgi:hypothetical protein
MQQRQRRRLRVLAVCHDQRALRLGSAAASVLVECEASTVDQLAEAIAVELPLAPGLSAPSLSLSTEPLGDGQLVELLEVASLPRSSPCTCMPQQPPPGWLYRSAVATCRHTYLTPGWFARGDQGCLREWW